jgi:predicted phage terminase large subunit-like protein
MKPETNDQRALAALTDAELDEYLEVQEDLVGGEPLRGFMGRMTPHHAPPPHLDPIVDALEESRVGRLAKWAISMPPGHGKTTVFLNAFGWWLAKFPADTCAYNSFSAPAALSKSVVARQLALRAGVEMSYDVNSKGEWRTTAGGGLVAGGLESLTGKRVQGPLVIDDPYSGPLDANSPAYREEVWNALMTVAMTRREGGPLFLVHTRWHPDDAIGRIKKQKLKGWRFIDLPAIDDSGRALWHDMHPLAELEEIRATIGEYNFASLYQQQPRPRGGTVFEDPRYYDPATTSFEGCRIVIAGDPAASEKTSADYSTIVVLSMKGVAAERVAYVRAVYRRQVTIPKYIEVLRQWQQDWGNAPIYVEAVAGFKAIPQMLRAMDNELVVRGIRPIGDKFTRAQGAAAAWNQGRLLVPSDSPPWLGAFLDEVLNFTGVHDAHDDQVDALAHGWNSGADVSIFDVIG